MHRQYHSWWSPALQREMKLLEFGQGGATVIVYPTSGGKFHEWEDRRMIHGGLGHAIESGWFHVICVDSVDRDSWYAKWKHPGARAWHQELYDSYVLNEVLPFAKHRNPHAYTIATGASFGAYHALDFAFRHPDRVNRVLGMSGLCDIRRFTDGFTDDKVYHHNPIQFLANEHDGWRLDRLRRMDVIHAVGNGDGLVHQNRELSGVLWSKGIGNALREWDGFAHDWPVWERQVQMYLGGNA